MTAPDLRGAVAIVTGASRGVGKGVALGLGEAGATVYVTGRTVTPGALPGTIAETAAQVTALGGRGVAVRCDHAVDAEVEALFARVDADEGRLDVLVNNAFAIPDGQLAGRFWELPIAHWDTMHTVGLRSHYVAAVLAARRMVAAGRGLIANISSFGAKVYAVNVAYGVGKAGVDCMTRDMGRELAPHGVAVVSLWPGIVRTERLLLEPDRLGYDPARRRVAAADRPRGRRPRRRPAGPRADQPGPGGRRARRRLRLHRRRRHGAGVAAPAQGRAEAVAARYPTVAPRTSSRVFSPGFGAFTRIAMLPCGCRFSRISWWHSAVPSNGKVRDRHGSTLPSVTSSVQPVGLLVVGEVRALEPLLPHPEVAQVEGRRCNRSCRRRSRPCRRCRP